MRDKAYISSKVWAFSDLLIVFTTASLHRRRHQETAIPVHYRHALYKRTRRGRAVISLSSKRNTADWQTDCACNRLTDRRTQTGGKHVERVAHTFNRRARRAGTYVGSGKRAF